MNNTSSLNAFTVRAPTRFTKTTYTATITTTGFTVPTDLPVTFIDNITSTIVDMSNIVLGRSYRLALSTNNMWSNLITNAPSVGITINAYNPKTNKVVHTYNNLAQTTGSFVFNGTIRIFMYGLGLDRIPLLSTTKFGTILIQL